MEPTIKKGNLTTWKDDRGFGFITPDEGGKEIFLHISALKGASRRPKIGDTILYQRVSQPDGKIRATNASIQGVASRPLSLKRQLKKKYKREITIISGLLGLAALMTFFIRPETKTSNSFSSLIPANIQPGCVIKGNISISTGNKLYHLPGMEDYESTRIESVHGERWFCTESEAIAAGWRKAPR